MISFFAAPFVRVSAFWEIFWSTTIVELRSKYAGSVLGIVWLIISPIILMAIYTLVYTVVFRIQPPKMTLAAYVIYIFSGLLPLIAFSSSLSEGATSLSANRQILLNTVFPSELVPLRAAVMGMASMPIGLAVLLGAAVFLVQPAPTFLLVPFVLLLQLMFQAGVAWVLSLITLVLRDVQHILQYVTMILIVITPIGYTPDMIPTQLRILMYANPIYYYVATYQSIIVYGEVPSPIILSFCCLLSLISFCGGFWVFQRAKLAFYDYV